MKGFCRLSVLAGVGFLAACGSSGADGGVMGGPSTAGTGNASAGTNSNPTAGNSPGGSSTGGGNTAGSGTAGSSAAGGGMGGTGTAGAGGSAMAGAGAGAGAGGSGGGGSDVAHPLKIDATMDLHTHTVAGNHPAGVDTRLPKPVGKLIVNVEVDNGGIYDYGIKHGFHVLGENMYHCVIPETPDAYMTKGRDFTGNCRWETLDGVDHDASAMVTPADSIMGKVKAALTELADKYPEEGWPYFLNAAGDVRWSDVGFTGYSHGGTSAIRWAKKLKVWRAVARSAPRDNVCGQFAEGQCPDSVISSWLDEVSATPVENLYGLDGTQDGEYKDFVFSMARMKFPGELVDIGKVAPPYNGSHRMFVTDGSNFGHDDFTNKRYWPAMDVIWDTPAENVTYANSH
jgi:hypothetical protein